MAGSGIATASTVVRDEPTTAIRQAEVLAARRMIERTAKNFALQPSKLLGDSAYGSADMLGWLVDERGIEPHVTVFDKSARKDGTFARKDFNYDPAGDVYICPGRKTLTTTGTRVNDGERASVSIGMSRVSAKRFMAAASLSGRLPRALRLR